jgi:hypothetical protein
VVSHWYASPGWDGANVRIGGKVISNVALPYGEDDKATAKVADAINAYHDQNMTV